MLTTCTRNVLYMTKLSLDKNFTKPSYLCIAEIFGGINFRQYGKGCHILNVIINTGQNICAIKISPIRADGEIGKNFLLAKISTYTVLSKLHQRFWFMHYKNHAIQLICPSGNIKMCFTAINEC